MIEKELEDKLVTVAGIIPKAYESGIEEGKVREREAFWNALLQDGNRASFEMLFQGYTWDFSTFYPTRDLIIRGSASKMFFQWIDASRIPFYKGSLINRLNECGVVLDTSRATNLTSLFNYTYITEIPTIDFTNAPNSTHCFANGYYYLIKIEKIIVTPETTYTSWFVNALGLVEIRIEGTIGQNGFDIHWSKTLSKASIQSILDALSRSPTVESPTITFSKTAVDKAYETSPGANDGSESYEWLVACQGPESPNAWNIIILN
jgi:hypothetical protein